jgi:plasmid stabilization system protein ParE
MTYQVILQPEAEREIRQQARWIVEQSNSPATALRWVNSIRSKIATLKASPLRCPIDPDSDAYGEEVRVLLHGKRNRKFRVLFILRGDTVRVVAIRHAAQRGLAEEMEANPLESDDIEPSP